MRADWLEELVWNDVRAFLENPGEALERVREQRRQSLSDAASGATELSARQADLGKRLAASHKERDRWLHLYAQGHISDEELGDYLADLRVQTDNLRLLLESVEADLAHRHEETEIAESAEAWLLTLRERIHEVEGDTEEAFAARRELVKLLVEQVVTGRDDQGSTRVEITFRFGEPPTEQDQGMLSELTNGRVGPILRRARTPRRSPRGNERSGSHQWSRTRNTS